MGKCLHRLTYYVKLTGMSKPSRSNLTGSRKTRRRPSRKSRRPTRAERLTALDAIEERFERIELLAGLMEACGDPNALDWRLAARAGYVIERELSEVKELVEALTRPGGKP
jgi:hypothetical protein